MSLKKRGYTLKCKQSKPINEKQMNLQVEKGYFLWCDNSENRK